MLYITDNIYLDVIGNIVFICSDINKICIKWSYNSDFIDWIYDMKILENEIIFNEKYSYELDLLLKKYSNELHTTKH